MKPSHFLLALALTAGPAAAGESPGGVHLVPEGTPVPVAPDFDFRPVAGPSFRLSSLRGRPVVMKFWATWCSDCVREMPQARALLARFAPRGVQFLGVSKDAKKTPAEVLEAAQGYGQFYPLMVDQGPEESRVTKLYEISWIPTVFLVDGEGRVQAVAKDLDGEHLEEFAAAIEATLAAAQPGGTGVAGVAGVADGADGADGAGAVAAKPGVASAVAIPGAADAEAGK